MTSIEFNCDDVIFQWDNSQALTHWLSRIAQIENNSISGLSFVYCSDNRLLEINQKFLDHHDFTDVITFDLSDEATIEGEVYISLERVRANSEEYNNTFENELCRVMAHGLLHLLGYNDKTVEEKSIMKKKEDACLSLLQEVPRGTFSV